MGEQAADLDILSTVRDYVRWGASRFNAAGLAFGHGTDNALDEAAALVLHTLSLPPDLPPVYLDAVLLPEERRRVVEVLERRVRERLPAAYITGEGWFAGLPFEVNEHVLVPRSPIAELVEQGFAPWLEPDDVSRVLDLCTGCGCIAVACAAHLSHARVDAVDNSPEAVAVARRNVERHGLDDRVRVLQSDLFDAVADCTYNVIVSNPPYVPEGEVDTLPPEYRHEPRAGFVAGADGLAMVTRILAKAVTHLEPGGILVVEVGDSRRALTERFPEVPFLWPEFERGGHGVFILTAEQLQASGHLFQSTAQS